MEDHTGTVLVVAEQNEGKVLSISQQLIGQARKLADKLGVCLDVVLLGSRIHHEQAKCLIASGADRVYLADSPELAAYQSEIFSEIIYKLVIETSPEIILLGSTSMGKELGPILAARLGTGLTVHCADLQLNDDEILEQLVPAYGVVLSIICPQKRPQMALVSNGVFPTPELDICKKGNIIQLDIPRNITSRVELLEIIPKESKGIGLATANIIVAGGAGAVDPTGWHMISELSELLNAGLGATRPAVDEGWINLESMIGQSGKIVGPELYIGVGISGELQHMVGIVGARVMVAINNDPKAPIFQQVDYGIVDDCHQFLPVFIETLREWKDAKVRTISNN